MFYDQADNRFADRMEAGLILAEQLKQYAQQPGVVLAIPRGGVPVGFVVAKELGFPLDIILSKKIGHPRQKEFAIGAVTMKDRILISHEKVSALYIEAETARIRQLLENMYRMFNDDKEPEDIRGKITIVVDDGIATGNTILTIINMLKKQQPKKIVIAVPVAARKAVEMLSQKVDEIICPLIPDYFPGVGAFYKDFNQLTNEDVKSLLDQYRQTHV